MIHTAIEGVVNMKCKNCKHWDKADFIAEDIGLPTDDTGECQAHTQNVKPIFSMLAVAICYTESISGEFITRGDFGCISFEDLSS